MNQNYIFSSKYLKTNWNTAKQSIFKRQLVEPPYTLVCRCWELVYRNTTILVAQRKCNTTGSKGSKAPTKYLTPPVQDR